MTTAVIEKIYNMALISKIKKHLGPKKLKKILKNLKSLAKEDLKEFSKLKIKKFKTEKEEKKPKLIIVAPIIKFQYYFEDLKKSNSKPTVNNNNGYKGEDTSSEIDDTEEGAKQKDSSDFSSEE